MTLTWEQYRFIARYTLASACLVNSNLNSNSTNSNRDYDRAVDIFAACLHSNLKTYVDLEAQYTALSSWPTSVFLNALDLALASMNLPPISTYVNLYVVDGWMASAFDVLPSASSGSVSLDYVQFGEVLSSKLAESLNPLIVRVSTASLEYDI